ncbi:MAG: 50S ribosomal protein L28 [Candidatus Krumholzibacteriota bacterium]|nr:50S ribosomal protein L28 [Candidatus Krumholzibacteriota bacterium]
MSRECAICGKKPMSGHNISHAHNVSNRRWLPNLQRIRVEIDGKTRRTWVCTQCIKSGAARKVV